MQHYTMNLKLKVWRQKNSKVEGRFESYDVNNISSEMSFLEMIDVLNEKLITDGGDSIAFDHDCREGICGMCSMVIDGRPHGPWQGNTTCQLHMRAFKDGDTINADFSEVLMKGLDGVLRYTEKDVNGEPIYKQFNVSDLSPDAQAEYVRISEKIKSVSKQFFFIKF